MTSQRPRSSLFGLIVVLCAVGSGFAADEPAATALTLRDCYRLALRQSETIAIQRERLKETEGRFLQALSGALPRASFELSEKRQDGTGGSAFTLKEIPERKFILTQPLFSGFKEFAAMGASRAEHRQRGYEQARAEQLLLVDVSDAFHLLLERREERGALETTRTALAERIDELKARERLGRSRPSEVASASAQLRRVEANLERVRGEETTTRQLLEFLTGRAPIGAVSDEEPDVPPVASEDEYVGRVNARPDVRAVEEAWRASQNQVTIAWAKVFPTVNLESNYYTKRVGASSGVDWDVLLKVDAPLFQGGQAMGAVRESAAKAREAKLEFDRTKREATLDIRDTYAKWQAALAQHEAFNKALQAAEDNYRLQVEDYRHNLVNNLDVLQALQALEDARRDAIAARYAAKQRYWQLRAATGDTS